MTTLELKYNPFTVKTTFLIEGREASLKCLGTGDKVRLRVYINDFFPEAIKKSNVGPGEECIIQFYGTQDAFEDVKKSYDDYMAQAAEGMDIKLPEFKPYPNNFNEMNLFIAEKRKNYTEQIEHKKEIMKNSSGGKNNIALSDVEKRFDKDKKAFIQIYDKNLEEANSIMEKNKEELMFVDEKIRGTSISNDIVSALVHAGVVKGDDDVAVIDRWYNDIFGIESVKVKKMYDHIIKGINSTYVKYCEETTSLFVPLYEKLENTLRSGVETILKDYNAVYPDYLPLNYVLQKNWQNKTFDITQTISDSCFSSMAIKETSSTERIAIKLINKNIEQARSSCQEYFYSVFDGAKQAFLDEAEKCKAYYLEQLQEFQETVKEKLSSTKQIEQENLIIEQEISALENKIESLNELQSEINKLAIT